MRPGFVTFYSQHLKAGEDETSQSKTVAREKEDTQSHMATHTSPH